MLNFIIFSKGLVSTLILLSFAYWINAQSSDDQSSVDPSKNRTHWINCTIDGEVKFDEDCLGWLSKFLTWLGLGIFIFFFLLCGCLWYCLCTICQIICCTERPREVIYTTYVYPTSYSQIP
jgi:hypothetical protein